jgi:hypothetical protein
LTVPSVNVYLRANLGDAAATYSGNTAYRTGSNISLNTLASAVGQPVAFRSMSAWRGFVPGWTVNVAGGTNVNLLALSSGWSGSSPITYFLTGTFTSTSTSIPAIDTGAFASTTQLTIINQALIVGMGGNAGPGGHATNANSPGADVTIGGNGAFGGPAFSITTACSITITNASGLIYGGGGGGGGGYGNSGSPPNQCLGGGGGGGGYGGGIGGAGGTASGNTFSAPGAAGGTGSTIPGGAGGAGGAGGNAAPLIAGAGGAGGGPGTAGATGGFPNGGVSGSIAGGSGGAAGKAINLNGHATPTFVSGGPGSGRILGVTS